MLKRLLLGCTLSKALTTKCDASDGSDIVSIAMNSFPFGAALKAPAYPIPRVEITLRNNNPSAVLAPTKKPYTSLITINGISWYLHKRLSLTGKDRKYLSVEISSTYSVNPPG